MVLFHNVNVGQRVEVSLDWGTIRGTVGYKGCLTGKQGDWVGVLLEERVGNCDGMVNGRRYFQCQDGYGLFVRSNRLRLYNKYHRVGNASFVEEPLFGNSAKPEVDNGPYDPIKITSKFHDRISTGRSYDDAADIYRTRYHPLCHPISRTIPAATMTRPRSVTLTYSSRPVHGEYEIDDPYITSPSIPKTHMPFSALRRQISRGWENSHYVREMSVPIGRDSMKRSQWNDISA
ncbi:DCTN1-like protein [Mya arenaria]|uniref:DCTN1-like protein n=1 Tax=Mya arenaria TaxID=6604 RepID=A0ABY7G308_MYAAR|nr:DCTN1-like protein [Mya arenaria]